MREYIYVFTKKRYGSILKQHGYKLQNMPVHARCGDEDELNKYVKIIEVNEFSSRSKVNEEVSQAQKILETSLHWFESPGIEVGNTCMGYINTSAYERRFYFWRK
jgi:hypothetical protein